MRKRSAAIANVKYEAKCSDSHSDELEISDDDSEEWAESDKSSCSSDEDGPLKILNGNFKVEPAKKPKRTQKVKSNPKLNNVDEESCVLVQQSSSKKVKERKKRVATKHPSDDETPTAEVPAPKRRRTKPAANDGRDEACCELALEKSAQIDPNSMVEFLNRELRLDIESVRGAVTLFGEGCTLPFIARYRKERTRGLAEDDLRRVEAGIARYTQLLQRRAAVLSAAQRAGKLDASLRVKLEAARTLAELEDIYLPFRPKRKTRASAARARGLQPLADMLLGLAPPAPLGAGPTVAAARFVDTTAGVPSPAEALAGARDIAAEEVELRAEVRARARELLLRGLRVECGLRKGAADVEGKYRVYHEFGASFWSLRPHQVLAMLRGEKEGVLNIKFHTEVGRRQELKIWTVQGALGGIHPACREWEAELAAAVEDGFARLLIPSLEREWLKLLKEKAYEAGIQVFSDNVRKKLLQPPVKGTSVLAIDPGAASGCKAAVVDSLGKVLGTAVIYPMRSPGESAARLREMMVRNNCTTIALGNGSYSRETEGFLRDRLMGGGTDGLRLTIVDESGASVYSASPLAQKELPDLDVTLRGAVSLARRIQDPLAEYVKIDPKSIGVGMYQHDVDQRQLAEELAQVVSLCVNMVGVDANTASPSLLQYIAGFNTSVAAEIVKHRDEHGPFQCRADLNKVKGIGKKRFEQAAGFLRIYGGSELLDATSIHPESYKAARKVQERKLDRATAEAADAVGVGLPTLELILEALSQKGGVDPRLNILGIPPPQFLTAKDLNLGGSGGVVRAASKSLKADQLVVGEKYKGVVRNVVHFGAFVDIGVQTDGLIHISKFPKGLLLQVGTPVDVRVAAIEVPKGPGKIRIALTVDD